MELRTTFSDQQEPLLWGLDHCSIQYKLEALFLLQQLIEVVQNNKKLPVEAIRDREAGVSGTSSSSHVSTQVSGATISDVVAIDIESREDATEVPSAAAQTGLTERKQSRNIQDGIVTLKRIYDARCAQLRSDVTNAIAGPEGSDSVKDLDNETKREPMDAVPLDHQDRLCQDTNIPIDQNQIFVQISVCEPQLLDALCWIIERQKRLHTKLGGKFSDCAFEHGTVLQLQVQEAMLTVIKEDFDTSDVQNCLRYLRYLHSDFGTSESAYREVIQVLVRKTMFQEHGVLAQDKTRITMLRLYEEALASGSASLPSLVEDSQNSSLQDAAEVVRASNEPSVPPPLYSLHECLKCLRGETNTVSQGASLAEGVAVNYCLRQLSHYSRATGAHMLERVLDAALSAIKSCKFQMAADILALFPRLQPLAAAMGWDLLAGNTAARQKMMHVLWGSKRMESSTYRKLGDEICCVDHLCDQLCYHLELAYFAARVNSGLDWEKSCALFLSQGGRKSNKKIMDTEPADPFVANLVLERLAMHSPIRILFDVVPDVKFKHATTLVKMLPVCSPVAERKRLQDLELLQMHYGIQAAVLAWGAMEGSVLDSGNKKLAVVATILLEELRNHLQSISNIPRRLLFMNIIVSLLHMDDISAQLPPNGLESKLKHLLDNQTETADSDDGKKITAVGFFGHLVEILRHSMPLDGVDYEDKSARSAFPKGYMSRGAVEAWEWRASLLRDFIDDWEWRLAVLQRLAPSPQRQWQWKEALAVLRAAPSTLLNMCVQRAQYDLGEEAVHRFALPPEDEAALQLAEWVDGAVASASVEDVVSRVAEGASSPDEALKLAAIRAPLAPLASVLLCVDVAAASARSIDMSKQLLHKARSLLAEISSGGVQRQGSSQAEQIQEACILSVAKRIMQCLQDFLEKVCLDKHQTLQALFSGMDMVNPSVESAKHGQRHRALNILQQTIEDAHNGKRQFLSGKLHNLVKALADEETEENTIRPLTSYSDRKGIPAFENGFLLGYGIRVPSKQPSSVTSVGPGDHTGETTFFPLKGTGKRFLGPLSAKPSAYLSAFILYIATIGDIVDGVDTTHDFNFFSLVYERSNDLLTRLVFERGSANAAGKIAEIMGADLVHQVISACVLPVYPPKSARGWACIPWKPSRLTQSSDSQCDTPASNFGNLNDELYPLRLDVVKHLATLSPVRATLACVFGASTFNKSTRAGDVTVGGQTDCGVPNMDTDRSFYEFALDQSDRFPTLNRWIQMQANAQRLSDFPVSAKKRNMNVIDDEKRAMLKRNREPESDTESEEDEEKRNTHGVQSANHPWHETIDRQRKETGSTVLYEPDGLELKNSTSLLFDWENEGIYEDAVRRLLDEGKLVDALALADRYLRGGAPDYLLQMLIEKGDDGGLQSSQWQGYTNHHNLWNISWQYCIRLRDKQLAAALAIKHVKKWELDAAIDVLTMCSCHLAAHDLLYPEVVKLKQDLQLYSRILRADGRFSNWQEVESLCQRDPEELALRLAGRGAVSAALEVAESYKLREELRRELQGRQLVKLLTSDPVNGGGPAEALRFLGSLQVPQDALPVAMAAMEQLPTLQSKQLLVHFFLKRRIGLLSDDELGHLNKLALGLHMLGALPLPWQQRCSALHEHPQLILETLLMWKQLQVASELLHAFPSLRDDNLILIYAAKAISVNAYPNYERRPSLPAGVGRTNRLASSGRTGIGNNPNVQREAQRTFPWTSRDSGNKIIPKEMNRKRKSTVLGPPQKAAWDAMTGVHEERIRAFTQDSFERLTPVTMAEGWVLTGDPVKDDAVRNLHRYESAPCITLFKALLSLCSSEVVAVKAAVGICIKQMRQILNSEQLPLHASSETIERGFHATDTFVQALLYAKVRLRKLLGSSESPPTGEGTKESSDGFTDPGSTEVMSENIIMSRALSEDLSELHLQVVDWLSRAELLQSLLGSGVTASLDDVMDKEAAEHLCDRLIAGERYNMAVYCCTKCKIDAFPVWKTWAHALVQMEHYAQARVKLKQALRVHKGDPAPIVRDIILTMEASPPVDVTSVRSLYDHMAKNASTILDDSLSADAYMNVLYTPSSFTKSERSRRSSDDTADRYATFGSQANGEEGLRSNLDRSRYDECVYYLQEYAKQDLLLFMFRHGHYTDACLLFFPPKSVPPLLLPSSLSTQTPTSSPQRADPLATDFGSIDDLCELCVAYGVMPVLERVIATREVGLSTQDPLISQHTAAALARVCTYCENHKHFNHLYRFQVLKKDHVAAGLCCIQLFLNSASQEQALRHLERAKMHFDEGFFARQQVAEVTKSSSKAARGKSPSERFSEEELMKFSTRIIIQMEVVRSFTDTEGPPWKHSLFGNPNDTDTLKRRAEVVETLVEKNFDLAFQVIYEFGLPPVHIYAAVAASLAERKKSNQLTELLKNIKATISDDDLDQVIGAAIMVFANKHRERPDRLIEMLSSSHRKVLSCVACGRLKTAFQVASRSGNIADVQYVAHQARQTGSLAVEDMCKQWLSRHL